MTRRIVVFLTVLFLFCLVVTLCACGETPPDGADKQVPVYLGMEVRGAGALASNVSAVKNSDSTDKKGGVTGDTTERDDDIDQTAPYDEQESTVPVEEKIESTFRCDYYR